MVGDPTSDYFRRDQDSGVTAPDLSKICTYADHIVRARGKRTQFTSVSLDRDKIDDFGPALYRMLRERVGSAGHTIIEHDTLLAALRIVAASRDKEDRLRAIQARRYVRRRREGLIEWNFAIGSIDRKALIAWAFDHIQPYFVKI